MIYCKDLMLCFNSGLDSSAFAKARFGERLDEKGVRAEKKDGSWTFSPWSFNATEEEKGCIVLKGPAFEGKMLLSHISSASKEKRAELLGSTAAFYEALIKERMDKLCIHPYQIYCDENFENAVIVPVLFFKTAFACLDENQKRFFVQPNLKGANALHFTQAAFAYYALTDRFPYAAQTEDEIAQDMRDSNFVRLEYSVYGLTPEVAHVVDDSLSQNPLDMKQLRKVASRPFPLEDFYEECGLEKDGSLKDGRLKKVERHSVLTREQFEEKARRAFNSKGRVVKAVRFVRSHSTMLKGLAVFVVVAGLAISSFYSSYLRKPSTSGLTSLQTLAFYYSSVNSLDTDGAQYSSYGPAMVERDKVLSNIYVTTKATAGYDFKSAAKDFAQWLCYNQQSFRIFGLSQFTVNGKEEALYVQAGTRKDRIPPLETENGEALYEGKTATYDVHFYLVNTATSQDFVASEYSDKVTLEFRKGRWLVVSIESDDKDTVIDREEFCSDYTKALEETGNNLPEAAGILRQKYSFIPTDAELSRAARQLEMDLSWN